jgi:hypothetical protein
MLLLLCLYSSWKHKFERRYKLTEKFSQGSLVINAWELPSLASRKDAFMLPGFP